MAHKINDIEIAPEICTINVDTSSLGGNFCKKCNTHNIKADKKITRSDFQKVGGGQLVYAAADP